MSEFLIEQAMREAIDLQNRNQLDDAKSIYKKIIAHDKNNSDAYHLISLIYLVEGKLDEAKNNIMSAIELQPEISVYHSNYGNILYQSNNLEFAIQEHKRAIKLDKKNFQSFYSLGVVYTHLKNYEKAAVKDGQQRYQKGLTDLVKLGKKKGINDAVTYLPLDQQKIWAETIKDWPNSRAKDITKDYGMNGAALMNAYMNEMEKTGHKFPVRYKIGG